MERDLKYLDNLSRWIAEESKGLISPKTYWIDDLSRKEGATKYIEHVKAFIDREGGSIIELNETYTMVRLYPAKDHWYTYQKTGLNWRKRFTGVLRQEKLKLIHDIIKKRKRQQQPKELKKRGVLAAASSTQKQLTLI